MFLHLLDEPSRAIFMGLAHAIAAADGLPDPRERLHLEGVLRDLGLSAWPEAPLAQDEALERLGDLDDPLRARVILLELAVLSAADGLTSRSELVLLAEVAARAGVERREVTRIIDYARRRIDLLQEGRSLIAAVTPPR